MLMQSHEKVLSGCGFHCFFFEVKAQEQDFFALSLQEKLNTYKYEF